MSPLVRALLGAVAGGLGLQVVLGGVVAATDPAGSVAGGLGLAAQAATAAIGVALYLRSTRQPGPAPITAAGLVAPTLLGLMSAAVSAPAGAGPGRLAVGIVATLLICAAVTWAMSRVVRPAESGQAYR